MQIYKFCCISVLIRSIKFIKWLGSLIFRSESGEKSFLRRQNRYEKEKGLHVLIQQLKTALEND